ncbi:MAG TPA: polyribonucleotide nucleotidyltransferase, partial [Parachlamydiaceae bacterium]|nr:polyribonucleotide nucleotidyltransferase [Parachlamydiaceae bacterium]
VKDSVKKHLLPEGKEPAYSESDISAAFKKIQSKRMRRMIVKENLRTDGRNSTTIRPIEVVQSFLPRTHGSSLFTRGETQSVAVCTLGGESMAQRFEDLHGENSHRFYLQYFFPPFSVGEVGRIGAPGRREVGHGKLAERALKAILPTKQEFPYVIRIESNITESNGSSSMATVCGGCLAMMDAGIPIKRPVAGIAMGLVLEKDGFTVLSDILGIEDALGDMDFKITGDALGITAFQMDIKVEGITLEIMRSALAQAKAGRLHILNKMLEVCPDFRKEMSMYAPRIETLQIKPSKIATVIGPGGKQIRAIIEATGVQIDIDDTGLISIAAANLEGIEKAKAIIFGLTAEVEIGRVYPGKITSIMPFGAFVEILPGKEGLCHISEFDKARIENLNDFAKVGDAINVKVLDINERGQLKLSRKATLPAN